MIRRFNAKVQTDGKMVPAKLRDVSIASLMVIAASGVGRALIIERSRARSGQRPSESGAPDAARGDDPYFFLFFAR